MKKLLLLFLLFSGALFAAELLKDPTFASAKLGSQYPAGWKEDIAGNGGKSMIVSVNQKNVLRISVADKPFVLRAADYINVSQGEKLTVNAEVIGKGTCHVSLLFFNKAGRYAGVLREKFAINGKTSIKKEFVVPADFSGKVPAKFLIQLSFGKGSCDVMGVSTVNDQTTPDEKELQKAIDAALKDNGIVQMPPKTVSVFNLTVPAGVTLRFAPSSKINILPGGLITLNGRIDSPLKEIFTGEGKITGRPDVAEVFPQWFGAKGDDSNDDGPALQKAADFAKITRNRKLNIPEGRYRFAQKLRVSCNIDAFGTLVIPVEPDYSKETLAHYVKQYPPVKSSGLVIVPDEPETELDSEPFYGVKVNSFRLPNYLNLALKNDPEKKIALSPGGTLRFASTDFFTSRMVNNNDHFYDPNDVFEVTDPRGAIFPESAFDYVKHTNVAEWSAKKVYKRGDYIKSNGMIYKASYPSGPGVVHKDRFKGTAEVGPVDPAKIHQPYNTVFFPITYSKGAKDKLMVWRKVTFKVFYTPPQTPLVFNNVRVELVAAKPIKEYTQIIDRKGFFSVMRSHVTFNNVRVENKEKFYRFYMLIKNTFCVNLVYNNPFVSGACHSSGGYNISNTVVGNVTFNNGISNNCRDSIAGRHGKYVTINGGHYGVIDDHYGKNYYINNVTFYPNEPWVPGFYTPKADHQKWFFRPTCCVRYSGSDITIENCRVYGGKALLRNRPDTADFGGRVVLRNISVNTDLDFTVFSSGQYPNFDYAHKVLVPSEVVIENVSNEGKGALLFTGTTTPYRWKVRVSGCSGISKVGFHNADWTFRNCTFNNADFALHGTSKVDLTDCVFYGKLTGFSKKDFRIGSDVILPADMAK